MALTLDYRPQLFKAVLGQQAAKATLSDMADKLPHLLLLTGEYGLGKTTLARIVAKRANCQDPNGSEPCRKCESCATKNHPDVVELNAADKRGIDEIRRLADVCRMSPVFKRKVFIIDECHMLTPQAFQASLKLFEEPPKHVTFIMVTTESDKLPRTILSRAQDVALYPVESELIAKRLRWIAGKEGHKLDTNVSVDLADASLGHPRDAIKMLDRVLTSLGSGKNIKSEVIAEAVKKVVRSSPKAIVEKFVGAILDEKLSNAFILADKVDNPEYFLLSVVKALQALVRWKADPSIVERYYAVQFSKMREIDFDLAAMFLKVFGRAYQQAKNYLVPADVLLDLAIADTAAPAEAEEDGE